MALNGGDKLYENGDTITKESDGAGSAGDFVTLNASGQVTPTASSDDDVYGVLAEDSPASAGEDVGVRVQGIVIANVAGTVTDGDVLQPSATAGQAAANAQGLYHTVSEGGTATYDLAMRGIQAYSDAGASVEGNALGANEAAVKLP